MPFSPNHWKGSQWMFIVRLFSMPEHVRWLYILKARQLGISTVCNAYDLYYNFRYTNMQSSLVTADYKIANEMRNTYRTMYQNLPLHSKRLKKADNSDRMSFKNGSAIKYLFTTAKKSQKGNMGRSGACNYAHFTECAFFQNVDDFNAFVATLSQEHPQRRYIFESTANGYNHYYDQWESAKESNTKETLFIGWWANEGYILTNDFDLDKYGYPLEAWEQESWDIVKAEYDYEVTMPQIAWWRKTLKEEMQDRGAMSRVDMMYQEYPWTEYESFRLTGKNFFNANQVRRMEEKSKKHEPIIRYETILRKELEHIEFKPSPMGKLIIWEEYDPDAVYILGADPSYGSNPDSDNGVITIYKCFKDCMEQVAEFADNFCDTKAYTWIMLSMIGMYHAPYILEVQGPGQAILDNMDMCRRWIKQNTVTQNMTIYDYAEQYRTEYLYKRADTFGSPGARHWVTSGAAKERLMFSFQTMVNNEEILIRSGDLVKELGTFQQDGNTLSAIDGKHDDRIIASALVNQYWNESFRSRLELKADYEARKAAATELRRLQRNEPEKAFSQNFMKTMILK